MTDRFSDPDPACIHCEGEGFILSFQHHWSPVGDEGFGYYWEEEIALACECTGEPQYND